MARIALTKSEKEIEFLLLRGLSNEEISLEVGCSDKTVKFHITNIFRKTGAKNRVKYIVKHYQELIAKLQKNLPLPMGGI